MDGTYVERAPGGKWTPVILGFWALLAVYFLFTSTWIWLFIVTVNVAAELYNVRMRSGVSYAATDEGLEIRDRRKKELAIPYGDILALRKHVTNKKTSGILSDFDCFRVPKAFPATGLGGQRWLLLYRDAEDGRDLPLYFEPSRKLRDLLRRRIYQAIEDAGDDGPGGETR